MVSDAKKKASQKKATLNEVVKPPLQLLLLKPPI
ncbi:hypothetical protein A2U01_0090580, partial [Trifolium medium]|nr:hypothetical protein [Trifolium medium]